MAALERRRFFEARAQFARIVAAFPGAAEAWYQIGRVDKALGRPLSAAQAFERALNLRPEQKEILVELERVASLVGRADYAAKLNRRLVKLDPRNRDAVANLGIALQQSGQFDEADKVFRKALRTWPRSGVFHDAWFRGRKIKSASDPALRHALKLWKDDGLPDLERQRLGFALAKAMEDIGETDRVFSFLRPANEIGKTLYPFDRAARRAEVGRYLDAASAREIARTGSSDFAPIFVIGMPRSGTTLTELILAAHPDVHAGGEIAQAALFHSALMRSGDGFVAPGEADPEKLASFARQFELSAREHAGAPEGGRVTDKSIQNNLIIGWLAAAFPRARFVVVRRDRHDVALSIYKNFFAPGLHNYGYDLADIASVQRNFDTTIAHWRERVDLVEVEYDALTADPEPRTRALIEGVGLPWHDDCLDFHTKKSTVRTLSLAQVRQPIYRSSSGGWRRYAAELQPFIEAWEQGA
jgi:tetratricopeptide (TPR) repeat protein